MISTQQDKAAVFHALHRGEVLVLPNAWDVASARIVEDAGAAAVATTSAGVAWSLGMPDGDRLDRDSAIELVSRIASAVSVPVTADIEGGFADDPAGVGETIRRVIAAGAVGVNLEDGPRSPEEYTRRLAAARSAADASGVSLYINARTDVYLAGIGEPERRLEEVLARAAAYVEAGADGIFVPGVIDPETLKVLAAEISVPMNALAVVGAPSIGELAALGVARVSVGARIAEAAYALASRAATELLSSGTYESLVGGLPHGNLNALLDR